MNNQSNNYYHHGVPNTTYHQPQFSAPPAYYTQGSNYPTVQANSVTHRSPWLLAFGIIDVIISGIIFIWNIYMAFGWSTTISVYLALVCAIFHLILGALSITGSRDGVRYRACVIASLVMGIVGLCIFVFAAITCDTIQWIRMAGLCDDCLYFHEKDCPSYCYINIALVFAPILVYTILQAIVCAVISGITCCNLCYCCGCCYTGETPSHSLIYTGSPPPYEALAAPHDIPTSSDGVAEPTAPIDKYDFD